jgi:Fur family zinc uptake transcriptional regulator
MTNNFELSNNERLVLDVLGRENSPKSAYMILDVLRGSGFRAPLQVYRALEKLIGMGRVHRLESLNAFIACNHISCEKTG